MPISTTINTIRHGQTDYGLEKRYAGSIDVPLSRVGIAACRRGRKALQRVSFDVVVTSHLARAVETGHLLVPDAPRYVQSRLCAERTFGEMEGLTWEEVQRLEPPVMFIEVGHDLHSVNPRGGESFEQVWQRALQFRRYLFREHRGSNILIVSHGVFIQMFHGVLRGITCIESLASYPANLEYSTFRFIGQRLVEENVRSLGGRGREQASF